MFLKLQDAIDRRGYTIECDMKEWEVIEINEMADCDKHIYTPESTWTPYKLPWDNWEEQENGDREYKPDFSGAPFFVLGVTPYVLTPDGEYQAIERFVIGEGSIMYVMNESGKTVDKLMP